MWRYVALYIFLKKMKKHDFSNKSKKTLWHYVALCGAIFLFEKIESFFQKNRCGAMWRYVALYIF